MPHVTFDDPDVARDYREIGAQAPFVYGLTNYIAANLSANVLLAAGAGPAIGAGADWPAVFPVGASGVWINTAAVMSNPPEVLRTVASAARDGGTPWVLDPVAHGAGAAQYDGVVKSLLDFGPAVIRGNASELITLAGGELAGKGVETTAGSAEAVDFVERLARSTGAVVAVSGATDFITDGTRTVAIEGGDVRLTKVTGAGCSLGALTAGAVAVVADPFRAAVASHAAFARAAELAAQKIGPGGGSGSFSIALIDGLCALAG